MTASPPTPQTAPIAEHSRSFNPSAARLDIAVSSDYIAHPFFHDNVTWRSVVNGNSVLIRTKEFEQDGSHIPADLIIVGMVSTDRPYLGDLGNWKEAYNMKLYDVKQQFTLGRPTGFIGFEDDFDVGVRRVKDLQEVIAKGSKKMWFVLDDDTLRFSHRLFQEKLEVPDESSDMEDHELRIIKEASIEAGERASVSKHYLIKDEEMQEPVKRLLVDYDLVPLEAYDRYNKLIPTKDLARLLKGALVQVTFNIHSNFINFQKVTNFKGQIVQIKILKNTTHVAFSPRKKGRIQNKMAEMSESQVEAVNKFLFPNNDIPRDRSVTIEDPVIMKVEIPEEGSPVKESTGIGSGQEDDKSSVKVKK